MPSPETPLTAAQAAQMIFRNRRPAPAQVAAVQQLIDEGKLPGTKGRTTAVAVADYIAAHVCRKSSDKSSPPANAPSLAARQGETLQPVYREVVSDFVLAVLFRRRRSGRGRTFARLVTATQVALLFVVGLAVIFALRSTLPATHTPEQAAVHRWLAEHTQRYEIRQWNPPQPNPDGPGAWVQVKYKYFLKKRGSIETERRFLIEAGRVVSIESDW